mgnify:CR=1 FL=1
MSKKAFEEYVDDFLTGVLKTINVDYSKPAQVRENNKGTDMYRLSAKRINRYYPDRIKDFANLLNSDKPKVRLCCAVCLIELCDISQDLCQKALLIIQEKIDNGTSFDRFVWSTWIESNSSKIAARKSHS